MTEVTDPDEEDVQRALDAADSGVAYYWPTVAAVLAAEVQKLRKELERYRSTVTTGGPPPASTEDWRNGPSSRPSTAPPDPEVVQLPAVDYVDEPPPR